MKNRYISKLIFCAMLSVISEIVVAQTTFNYTGAMQTYTIPAGVTSVTIECYGAQGPDNSMSMGGQGGYVKGDLAVTPGQDLYIFVGGMNGYNGGGGPGTGAFSAMDGTNGGGASDVRTGGMALTDRVIVAGGGGGAGRFDCPNQHGGGGGYPGGLGGLSGGSSFYAGQDGSPTNGGDGGQGDCVGDCSCEPGGGGGGGGDGGGGGGCYGPAFGGVIAPGGTGGACGANGDPAGGGDISGGGCFGIGGTGGDSGNGGGAGGGGGWYGGGAGGGNWAAGGGGGSSYFDPSITSTSFTNAINPGDGYIVITDGSSCTALITSVSDDEVCDGETVTFDASSTLGGTVTWDGGVTNGVPFTPPVGTTTYTATSDDPSDCNFSVDIVVNPLPTVDGGPDLNLCDEELATLTGSGTATVYNWSGGVIAGMPFTPPAGTTTYILTGEILATGCINTDDVDVTYTIVNESVSVAAGTFTCAQASATYQWIDCSDSSAMAGETGQTFTPTQDGDYAVIVTIGICTDTSDCINIMNVALESNENSSMKVYPNPATDELTIISSGAFSFELRSMNGSLVADGNGLDTRTIGVAALSSGIYTLIVIHDGMTEIREVVISH